MNDKETLLEIPRNKLNFVSKEAEMLFDLTMEVDWLRQENQQLKERINQYENPDDSTLFYMWLDEKAKDKLKQLDLYKSIIDEIKCKTEEFNLGKYDYCVPVFEIKEILNKIKENQ